MPGIAYNTRWEETKKRWSAFWERTATDRPCLHVTVPVRDSKTTLPSPVLSEDAWFQPELVEQYLSARAESMNCLGEAVPDDGSRFLMTGWTLGCGPHVSFTPDTIWHEPMLDSIHDLPRWNPGPDDPWRVKIDRLLDHLLEVARGRFLLTYPYQLPLNDLAAVLVGPDRLLLELGLEAEACGAELRSLLPRWIEAFEHFRRKLDSRQEGCTWGYPGMWSPDFVMITQSDVSCMFGPQTFEMYTMQELDLLGETYPRIWYHLDGKGARRHLPRLLKAPYIRAIQYVPSCDEEPNGPAHLDLYREVQTAHRCLDLRVPPRQVEYLIRRLSPEGLVIRTQADSEEAALTLLDNAVKWCGSDLARG